MGNGPEDAAAVDGHFIAEFRVSHPDFPLMETVASGTAFAVQSQFQPGTRTAAPEKYFVVEASDFEAVEAAAEADPSVTTVDLVTRGDQQRTYRVGFSSDTLLLSPTLVDIGVQIDAITRTGDRWRFRIFAGDRQTMLAAIDYARETCRRFNLDRLYTAVETDRSSVPALTDTQEETLSLAFREGYFEVPRETDLATLAAELGVSDSAVSDRLRKAVRTLVAETVGPLDS